MPKAFPNYAYEAVTRAQQSGITELHSQLLQYLNILVIIWRGSGENRFDTVYTYHSNKYTDGNNIQIPKRFALQSSNKVVLLYLGLRMTYIPTLNKL